MAELNEIPDDDVLEAENDDFQTIFANVAGDSAGEYKVKFYKIEGGKLAWVLDAHAVDMDEIMPTLRDSYGPGDYEARIMTGNRIVRRPRFTIANVKRPQSDNQKTAPSSDISVMLRGFEAIGQSIAELGKLIVTQQQGPQKSVNESMTETLQMMAMMKQVFDNGTPPINPMEQFMAGINFAKEVAGDTLGESEPSPGAVLMKLADKLAPVLEATLNRPPLKPAMVQQKRPTPARVPAPQRPATPTQNLQEPNDMNMMMKMAMRPQINALCEYANKGALPEQMAFPVLEAIPDSYFDMFEEFIRSPNAVAEMAQISPAVNSHLPWFNKLRDEIVRELDTVPDDFLTAEPESPIFDGNETSPEVENGTNNLPNDGNPIG